MKKLFFTILFFIALTLSPFTLKAQNSSNDYEEISVFLAVQGIGGYDISAIYKNNEIYIPVTDMFQALKINQKLSEFNDTLSGFFLYENNKYIISQLSHTVFVNGKLIQLSDNELFSTETSSLALRLDQYGKLFGLDCRFTFSSLMVELKTSHELPVIKELRLEQMRKNISRLRGEITVDTTYQRKYHILKGGMADWAVYSTQLNNGPSETRALLGLGAEFLGGETNIELNYSSKYNFEKRQQQYHWRWANNNTKLVKQVTVGKISSRSVASIYSPLIGTVITNTPTTYRRSFGSYTMSDFTEPGWTVELYINNIIVDFTTADAFGFFKFDIPLVYGASNVLIKFYGPWGEERTKEQIINVPFNFLPAGELQYSIAGAMVQDTSHSFFSRGEANFGISRHLTLGGGFEYLSSISASPSIPFVNGSAQIFSNLLVNAEYAHGVRTKALVSYSLPSNFVFDIDYTKYALEQKAITFNYREERKIRVSIPVSLKKIKAYSRFAYIQNILKETTYSTAEATISTFYRGVSANFTGNANWLGKTNPYIYGNLALGFRFFRTLSFRPQVQYDFSNKDLIYTKVELENNFSPKCNLALNWENNIRNNINSVELTLRYDLSFAQTSISTRISDQYIMTGQSARGSFAFGSGNARIIADRRTQVGRAGLTIIPFLDINNNNRHDDNEPVLSGMNVRINGGRILPNSRDSIIRILDLEPFASYMLEFSDTQFDNIAWQIPNKTLSILMDPNQFKLLEIPIKIMGEINGMIYIKSGNNLKPQGRILINIFDHKGNFIAKTQSESDGYFNYIGLAPGSYYAEIDSLQLSRLKSIPYPSRYDFNIHPSENGDIIDNIEFVLSKVAAKVQEVTEPIKEEIKPVIIEEIPVVVRETEKIEPVKKEVIPVIPAAEIENNATEDHKFFIHAGAFIKIKNAERLVKKLSDLTSEKWNIVQEDNFFKVRLGYFDSKEAANALKASLKTTNISYYISEIPLPLVPGQQLKESGSVQDKPAESVNNESSIVPAMDCEDSIHAQNGYFVQAGAFVIKSNAEKLVVKLTISTGKNWFIACGKSLYKVRLGYFTTKKEATDIERSLKGTGISFYVNKPKDVVIKDQPSKANEIKEQKQKDETVPVKTADVKEKKATAQLIPISSEKVVSNPPAKDKLPEPVKTAEKAVKKSKDGTVLVPPADDLNNSTEPIKFYIQAGAFDSKAHADRLAHDLLGLTLKRWFVVFEKGHYKVRLGYFTTKNAAKSAEETLNTTEVPYYVGGVIPTQVPGQKTSEKDQKNKSERKETPGEMKPVIIPAPKPEELKAQPVKQEEPNAVKTIETNPILDNENKTAAKVTLKPNAKSFVFAPPNDNTIASFGTNKFFIQANAMSNKAIAEQIAADLSAKTRKDWIIIFEDGLYKVRLGYFESKDEAEFIKGTLNTPDVYYYIDEIP